MEKVTITMMLEKVPQELEGLPTAIRTMRHRHRHCHHLLNKPWRPSLHSFLGASTIWRACNTTWKLLCITSLITLTVELTRVATKYSSFKDFMDTKPPNFKEVVEPLEADE
jgi:hypothetical protein